MYRPYRGGYPRYYDDPVVCFACHKNTARPITINLDDLIKNKGYEFRCINCGYLLEKFKFKRVKKLFHSERDKQKVEEYKILRVSRNT